LNAIYEGILKTTGNDLDEASVQACQKIVDDSYNKTNEMHKFLKFIFGIDLYKFRRGFLSIIRSLLLYTQQYADCLLADASSILIPLARIQHNLYDTYLLLCIQY